MNDSKQKKPRTRTPTPKKNKVGQNQPKAQIRNPKVKRDLFQTWTSKVEERGGSPESVFRQDKKPSKTCKPASKTCKPASKTCKPASKPPCKPKANTWISAAREEGFLQAGNGFKKLPKKGTAEYNRIKERYNKNK